MAAATSILHRANEAVAKEQRLAAVNELQSRVEDWKGHQIDHFGDLMLFGTFTVLKGEGAKEVEREVREIFFSLSPYCRNQLRQAIEETWNASHMFDPPQSPPSLDWRLGGMVPVVPGSEECTSPNTYTVGSMDPDLVTIESSNPAHTGVQTSEMPFPQHHASGLEGVPEGAHDAYPGVKLKKPFPALRTRPSRSSLFAKSLLGYSPRPLQSPSTASLVSPSFPSPLSPYPPTRQSSGNEGSSTPPTPSRSGKGAGFGKLSEFGSKIRAGRRFLTVVPDHIQPVQATNMITYPNLRLFNGALKDGNQFLTPRMGYLPQPTFGHVARIDHVPDRKATALEKDVIEELKLTNPVRIQYKVYLFERILLCCKEVNPNKPKNKMLGNTKPLVDKKGKPRLQLKGRIFMQNVTDVISVVRSGMFEPRTQSYGTGANGISEKSEYKIQIYWKGDPGVENFVIRFNNESDMNTWRDQVQLLKKTLTESARSSGQTGTSETEFLSMKDQNLSKNPYIDEDAEEEDYQTSSMVPGSGAFTKSRNNSNTSLRSAAIHPNGTTRPPRFPLPDPAGVYAPPLSVMTNLPPGMNSPGEIAGNSYFSPGGDSPQSTRSSSQASMYGFQRQTTPRLSNDDGKHRTAPAVARVPSRDGTRPMNGYTLDGRTVLRPSLPVMAGPQTAHQQLTMTQSRLG